MEVCFALPFFLGAIGKSDQGQSEEKEEAFFLRLFFRRPECDRTTRARAPRNEFRNVVTSQTCKLGWF